MSVIASLSKKITKPIGVIYAVWQKLTKPRNTITNPERRRRMRLLSALIIVLLPITASGAIVTTFISPSTNNIAELLWGALILFMLAFLLNYYNHAILAITLVLAVLSFIPFISWYYKFDYGMETLKSSFQWSLMAILVGAYFQDSKGVFLLTITNLTGLYLLPIIFNQVNIADIIQVLYYLGPMTILIVAGSFIREGDVKKIQAQANALIVEEAKLHHLLKTNPAVVYAANPPGTFGTTFISANVHKQLGYSPEDFTGDKYF